MGGGFYALGALAGYPGRKAREKAVQEAEEQQRKVDEAVATSAWFKTLIGESDKLDLKGKTELFQEYLGAGHIDGLPETAYLTPEGFMELEASGLLEAVGLDAEQAAQEAELGRDVRVPVPRLLASVTGENAEIVARHLKLTAEGISAAQAEGIDAGESFRRTQEMLEGYHARTNASDDIKQELVAQYLNAKPGANLEEAEAETAPIVAFAEKIGPLLGMTPDEYVKDRLVGIVGEDVGVQAMAVAAQKLNQTKPELKALVKRWADDGVKLSLQEREDQIVLSKIVVPEGERGGGSGSAAMEEVARYADENGKVLSLTPSTDFGGSSVSRLKKFYKRFGFIENKGKNKDFSISESMYRAPQSPAPAVSVKADELGEDMPLNKLRAAAMKKYKEFVDSGMTVETELGLVRFNKTGMRKTKSFSADARKLQLVPFLPDLLSEAKGWQRSENHKVRDAVEVKAYHRAVVPARISGVGYEVSLIVRETVNGEFHYDLSVDAPVQTQEASTKAETSTDIIHSTNPDGAQLTGNKAKDDILDENINLYEDGVNIGLRELAHTYHSDKSKRKQSTCLKSSSMGVPLGVLAHGTERRIFRILLPFEKFSLI